MNKNLYLIENSGCDATTYGIYELSTQELNTFKQLVENLNKNSYYGCMPTISIYEISWDDLKEVHTVVLDCFDEGYVSNEDKLYFEDKIFTWKEQYSRWNNRKLIL